MNRAFPNPDSDPAVSLFGLAPETLDLELFEPLSALRRSLSELGKALDEDPERGALLGTALEHLSNVDRCAHTVAEYASPAPLELGSCELLDVANEALAAVPPELRSKVCLTHDNAEQALTTDRRLFAERLAALICDAALHSKGEVMLHVHADSGVAFISVVEAEPRLDRSPVSPESLLALRDLERLNAQLSVRLSDPSHRCVIVRVTLNSVEQAQ